MARAFRVPAAAPELFRFKNEPVNLKRYRLVFIWLHFDDFLPCSLVQPGPSLFKNYGESTRPPRQK